jgi:hypothetical protein
MNRLILVSISVFSFRGALMADTISLTLLPSSEAVTAGQTVNVDVRISGLGNPPSVGAFDLGIGFNPTLLGPAVIPAIFGPFLGDPSIPTALTAFTLFPGAVEFAEVSLLAASELDSLQAMEGGSFTLGTLSFTALNSGTASFALSAGVVDDAFGNKLFAVPEPSAATVLGPVLFGIIGLTARKQASSAGAHCSRVLTLSVAGMTF